VVEIREKVIPFSHVFKNVAAKNEIIGPALVNGFREALLVNRCYEVNFDP